MSQLAICSGIGGADPFKQFVSLAEAGFTHLHLCYLWYTDAYYEKPEIEFIRKAIRESGLTLLDLHGSHGIQKCWYSEEEFRRQAGVLLVKNRIETLDALEGIGSLIVHIPTLRTTATPEERAGFLRKARQLRRSLDELMPVLEKYDRRIAVENCFNDTFEIFRDLMANYPPERLGIVYDSGHGNYGEAKGIDNLWELRDRLIAIHLNDNDGTADMHQPPFYGNVAWEKMARLIVNSSYKLPLNFEISMKHTPFNVEGLDVQPESNIRAFLDDACRRCVRFAELCDKVRAAN